MLIEDVERILDTQYPTLEVSHELLAWGRDLLHQIIRADKGAEFPSVTTLRACEILQDAGFAPETEAQHDFLLRLKVYGYLAIEDGTDVRAPRVYVTNNGRQRLRFELDRLVGQDPVPAQSPNVTITVSAASLERWWNGLSTSDRAQVFTDYMQSLEAAGSQVAG